MRMMRCSLHICAPGFVRVGMFFAQEMGGTRVRAWARVLESLMLMLMFLLLPGAQRIETRVILCEGRRYRQKGKMCWESGSRGRGVPVAKMMMQQ